MQTTKQGMAGQMWPTGYQFGTTALGHTNKHTVTKKSLVMA